MMGKDLWLRFDRFRESFLKALADAQVQFLPLSTQQRAVRGILDQGMLKDERAVRRLTPPEDQTGIDQLREDGCEFGIGPERDSR
jgi:hypothetical protein